MVHSTAGGERQKLLFLKRFPRWVRSWPESENTQQSNAHWGGGLAVFWSVCSICNVRLRKPPGGWYWHLPFPGNRSGPKTWKHSQGESGIGTVLIIENSSSRPGPRRSSHSVSRSKLERTPCGWGLFHLILAVSFCGYHQPRPGMRKRPSLVSARTILHKDAQ